MNRLDLLGDKKRYQASVLKTSVLKNNFVSDSTNSEFHGSNFNSFGPHDYESNNKKSLKGEKTKNPKKNSKKKTNTSSENFKISQSYGKDRKKHNNKVQTNKMNNSDQVSFVPFDKRFSGSYGQEKVYASRDTKQSQDYIYPYYQPKNQVKQDLSESIDIVKSSFQAKKETLSLFLKKLEEHPLASSQFSRIEYFMSADTEKNYKEALDIIQKLKSSVLIDLSNYDQRMENLNRLSKNTIHFAGLSTNYVGSNNYVNTKEISNDKSGLLNKPSYFDSNKVYKKIYDSVYNKTSFQLVNRNNEIDKKIDSILSDLYKCINDPIYQDDKQFIEAVKKDTGFMSGNYIECCSYSVSVVKNLKKDIDNLKKDIDNLGKDLNNDSRYMINKVSFLIDKIITNKERYSGNLESKNSCHYCEKKDDRYSNLFSTAGSNKISKKKDVYFCNNRFSKPYKPILSKAGAEALNNNRNSVY